MPHLVDLAAGVEVDPGEDLVDERLLPTASKTAVGK
tara:strand:+ start:316 stop:423 length:108 start_codon:yes stop_codon:yes gene_type:complete